MIIFKLTYKGIKKGENLKLFGDDFFRIYHKKYKMIINNKLFKLSKDYLIEKETNLDKLKVKLIILRDYYCNFKYMFKDTTISKFSIGFDSNDNNENVQNDVLKNYRKDNNNEINNLDNPNDNLYKKFYQKENLNFKEENEVEYTNSNNLSHNEPFSRKLSDITLKNDNSIINSTESINKECSHFLHIKEKKIKVTYLDFMFLNCKFLESINGFSQLDISKCSEISGLFENCTSLKSISDISQWETQEIKDISRMFVNCSSL